jgi:protein gp37
MKFSAIEWTDHTFNPWWGCTNISPGCDNCYAQSLAHRYGQEVWGDDNPRRLMSDAHWSQSLAWNREAETGGVRYRVFCASMADVFEDRPDLVPHRLRLLKLIDATPNLDWLLLTKRPHLIKRLLPRGYDFPSHVWLGTTVEDQIAADKRPKHILEYESPAVRFLSCEPLLGPVDIRRHLGRGRNGVGIDWVIVGGESGHGARPMNPEWAESVLEQCQDAGVPFLFKQWGNWAMLNQVGDTKRKVIEIRRQDGSFVEMANVGKHAAGRSLNGQEWLEFPLIDRKDFDM